MFLETSQREDIFSARISRLFPHLYTSCHKQEVEELRGDFPGLTGAGVGVGWDEGLCPWHFCADEGRMILLGQ